MTPEQTYRQGLQMLYREFGSRQAQIKATAEAGVSALISDFNAKEASLARAAGMTSGQRAKAVVGTGQGDVRLGFVSGPDLPASLR